MTPQVHYKPRTLNGRISEATGGEEDDKKSVANMIEDCFDLKPGFNVKLNKEVFARLKEELKRRFTPSCEVSNLDSDQFSASNNGIQLRRPNARYSSVQSATAIASPKRLSLRNEPQLDFLEKKELARLRTENKGLRMQLYDSKNEVTKLQDKLESTQEDKEMFQKGFNDLDVAY